MANTARTGSKNIFLGVLKANKAGEVVFGEIELDFRERRKLFEVWLVVGGDLKRGFAGCPVFHQV